MLQKFLEVTILSHGMHVVCSQLKRAVVTSTSRSCLQVSLGSKGWAFYVVCNKCTIVCDQPLSRKNLRSKTTKRVKEQEVLSRDTFVTSLIPYLTYVFVLITDYRVWGRRPFIIGPNIRVYERKNFVIMTSTGLRLTSFLIISWTSAHTTPWPN